MVARIAREEAFAAHPEEMMRRGGAMSAQFAARQRHASRVPATPCLLLCLPMTTSRSRWDIDRWSWFAIGDARHARNLWRQL